VFLLLAMMVLVLSSCASRDEKSAINTEGSVATEEAEVVDYPSREAVFVYGKQKELPKVLILKFGGEPILLPSGYVRLVGVVSGGNPLALIEVGGRGLCLQLGETFSGYQVAVIDQREIKLVKKEKL